MSAHKSEPALTDAQRAQIAKREAACVRSGGHYRDNQSLCHQCGVELDDNCGEVLAADS